MTEDQQRLKDVAGRLWRLGIKARDGDISAADCDEIRETCFAANLLLHSLSGAPGRAALPGDSGERGREVTHGGL